MDLVLGIDVGTGSARAGLFTRTGTLVGQASVPTETWTPRPGHVQQSSRDIWDAVCAATRAALRNVGDGHRVRGIGVDATCSLVVLDPDGAPVSVDVDGASEQDVIVWMDHRAGAEADRINATGHPVLRYVGGRISLEMETPKLLWLKRHRPEAWRAAGHFLDLPDFLTWRATGSPSRSLCSTVCKWTYLGHEGRWDEGYFRAIGLGDLADEGFRRIGDDVRPLGGTAGLLTEEAAAAMGLAPGIPVGVSAIDAHAGGLGVIGAPLGEDDALLRRVALVGGTSSCHMAVSPEPVFVPGVWGPYASAMIPGLWLNEGGQSATGALIDHVILTHAAHPALASEAAEGGRTVYEVLNGRVAALEAAERPEPPPALTAGLHVLPDHHGNRSPRADATLRGMVSGLTLQAGADDLARLYLATIQAVAYGTRHIIEAMNAAGYRIDTIMACGGGTRNPLFLREHAAATGCRIVLPREADAVLLGAAMLGAVAGGVHPALPDAMAAMSHAGTIIAPPDDATRAYHDAKYAVFHRMHADQLAYRALMAIDQSETGP